MKTYKQVQCYVKAVILWLSELQLCELHTKKQKKCCLFKLCLQQQEWARMRGELVI